jgi:uncharacterized phage protein (TIGR01671 family)
MREIKFRAWDSKYNRWLDNCSFANNQLIINYSTNDDGEFYIHDESSSGTEDVILMQYTGLKDKNGVEIYEGDVIRIKLCSQNMIDPPMESHETYEVTWSDEFLAWMFCDGDELLSSCDVQDMEVIGNIHQNKELR